MINRLLLFVILGTEVVFAGPVPTPGTQRVGPVFKTSDLVCDAYVESLQVTDEKLLVVAGKSLTRRTVLATVAVKDAYKNAHQIGARVYVTFREEIPASSSSMTSLSRGETYLMFLKASSLSSYEFADSFFGATPFSSLSLQDRPLGLSKLESALRAVLQLGTPDDQVNAMRILQGFDELGPETISALLPKASSANPEVALSSIAVRLNAKAPGSARALETYLSTHKMEGVPVAVLSIGAELGKISNVEDLPALEALASSEHLSIKLGAMAALRNIRSPLAGRALMERLDDPNADVRYLAVITLSEVFSKGGDYAPNMYQFDHDPGSYTDRWKTWWAQQANSNQQ